MIQLNKKQMILIIAILIIIVLVIIYYFEQNFKNIGYKEIENNVFENIEIKEEKESEILIHITGAVGEPGVVHLKKGARVIDAIEESGGLLEEADLNKVNLAYPLSDGQKVYIPSINDDETEQDILNTDEEEIIQEVYKDFNNEKININTATQTELETLPGIGTSMAYRIIQYRKDIGEFNQIEDIKNVSGIGDSKFNQIQDLICVK